VQDVLEITIRREIMEEVGVEVHDDVNYVESHSFVADGEPYVDIVFLCRHKDGEACSSDLEEVDSIIWMSYEEITEHKNYPLWTKDSLKKSREETPRNGMIKIIDDFIITHLYS
jgi:8-oxo-dGTP diphosphatase